MVSVVRFLCLLYRNIATQMISRRIGKRFDNYIPTFVDRDLETSVSLYTASIISSKLILMISTDPGRRSRSHIITAPYTHVLHLMIFLIQFCRESSEPTPLSVESYPICVILPKYLISTLTVRPHLSNDSRLTSATQKSTLTLSC